MILTTQEQQNNLIAHAYHRELEILTYQTNIDNYTQMLTQLPTTDWPVSIVQYKDTKISDLPLTVSDVDVEAINNYQYRDQLQRLLRSEKTEQAKSGRVLDALKTQIVGDYASLISQYKSTV